MAVSLEFTNLDGAGGLQFRKAFVEVHDDAGGTRTLIDPDAIVGVHVEERRAGGPVVAVAYATSRIVLTGPAAAAVAAWFERQVSITPVG